jgi:predicted ABC-type ATPase
LMVFVPFIMPNLYIIAGCNGAGKTTASYTVLPEMLNCKEFVNADEIAKGLSPFQPETVSFEAGRIMLGRIQELMDRQIDFAFETTLSTKSYVSKIHKAKELGYRVILIFFWLDSIALAKERVKSRVAKGGHDIKEDIVERRYVRGIHNLLELFIPIVDAWFLYDNSATIPFKIAEGNRAMELFVNNHDIWTKIKNV